MRRTIKRVTPPPLQTRLAAGPFRRNLVAAGVTPTLPVTGHDATNVSGKVLPRTATRNGSNTSRFDGSTTVIQYPNVKVGTPLTLVVEFTPNVLTGTMGIMSVGNAFDSNGICLRTDTNGLTIDAPTAGASITGFTLTANQRYVVAVSLSAMGQTPVVYADGKALGVTGTAGGTNGNTALLMGGQGDSGSPFAQFPFTGDIGAWGIWNRVFSADEMREISLNPYQLFTQDRRTAAGAPDPVPFPSDDKFFLSAPHVWTTPDGIDPNTLDYAYLASPWSGPNFTPDSSGRTAALSVTFDGMSLSSTATPAQPTRIGSLAKTFGAMTVHAVVGDPTWTFLGDPAEALTNGQAKVLGSTIEGNTDFDLDAGNVIVVWVACDNVSASDGNTNTVLSVTDASGAGNVWTKAREFTNANGAAGAGATIAIFYAQLNEDLPAASTITVNFSTPVLAKSMIAQAFRVGSGYSPSIIAFAGDLAVDSGTLGSQTISGLDPSRQYLFLKGIASERSGFGVTPTAGFTPSGTNTTSGSTADTNMEVAGEYLISSTASATSEATAGTNADQAAVFVALTLEDISRSVSLDKPFGAMTVSSAVTSTGGTGFNLAKTFGAMVSSSTGKVTAKADLSKTFGAMTISAETFVFPAGGRVTDFSKSFGAMTSSATGAVSDKADFSKSFGAMTSAGAVVVNTDPIRIVSVSGFMGEMAVSSTVTRTAVAQFDQSFDAMTSFSEVRAEQPVDPDVDRAMTQPQVEALQAGQVLALLFVEIMFTQPVRTTNAGYTIEWDGKEWIGLGNLGSMEPIEENAQAEARGVAFTLSGIPSDMVATALGEQYQGKRVNVWFVPLDEQGIMLDNPVRIFSGRADTMDIEVGESATITLTAESRMADWSKIRGGRFNHADQISRYPDDRGLEYVAGMVDANIVWGKT